MNKKIIGIVAFGILAGTLMCTSASGADFKKIRDYQSFADINESAWYSKDVKSAYETGLINGMGDGIFLPDGTMTVAQGITLAVRMNVIYNGKDTLTQKEGVNWYDVYTEYAFANGIIKDKQFDNYDRAIKRNEMISLFAAALPKEYFNEKNTVLKIPDVKVSAAYYNDLMLFYKAGIVMGSDDYGTFNPDAGIKRSEVSAIVNRVANPNARILKTLIFKTERAAFTLAHNTSMQNPNSGLGTASGWSFDNRGGSVKTNAGGPFYISDISDKLPCALVRDLTLVDSGTVKIEGKLSIKKGFDGIMVEVLGSDGKTTYRLVSDNNAFCIMQKDGTLVPIMQNTNNETEFKFIISLDLDTSKSETVINFNSYGFHDLIGKDIKTFRYASTNEDKITAVSGTTGIYGNYSLYDDFELTSNGETPFYWETNSDENSKAYVEHEELRLVGTSNAESTFSAISGNTCFETIFMQDKMFDGAAFTLMSEDTEVIKFSTLGGFVYANGQKLREYSENMWYTVRIESDLEKNTALIKMSGKVVGEVPLLNNAPSINKVKVSVENSNGAMLRTDNYKVSQLFEYADYIKAPIKPEGEENYNIGINVCSLWRNDSTHWGWDVVTPYDEIKPLLGYYDEGNPEVSDYEIKWMAEHGIDFEFFCWYSSESNAPIKTTRLASAIHDGYFNAKYSEYTKFALLWEAANAVHPSGSEAFRKYFVPYWIEYFFKDSRYMTIDNKPVMGVFGTSQLIKDFGSAQAVKEELDYLRSEVKKLGFDDMIIIGCSDPSEDLKNCGFDGSYAYNWGKQGNEVDYTKNRIIENQKKNILHVVPTISTGFNNVAWAQTRSQNMTVEDFKTVTTWVRDEVLKGYENENEKWKKSFLMLSTWNEYGEGTYMMPSGLNEFGYLDALREVFSKGGTHTDDKPNTDQLARMNYMFPQYRHLIRPLWSKAALIAIPENSVYMIDFTNSETVANFATWSGEFEGKADGLYGKALNNDPGILSKIAFNVDINNVSHIKVKMKIPKGAKFEMFFTTDIIGMDNFQQGYSFNGVGSTDDMYEYIIPVKGNPAWKGILKKFRIDPVSGEGQNFQLVSIDFLGNKVEKAAEYKINDIKEEPHNNPTIQNDFTMIEFNPENADQYKLNCFFNWDKDSKVLKLFANNNELVLTMDSSKAIFNGKEIELGSTPYMEDGLPMIPAEKYCELNGFKFEKVDGILDIITLDEKTYEILKSRKTGEWEFAMDGDTEGWYSSLIELSNFDGILSGTTNPINFDPIMLSPKFKIDTARYTKIEISMKHKITNKTEGDAAGFYFVTDTDANWDQPKYVGVGVPNSSEGKFLTYTFDMSKNEFWRGNVIQLRFDPFNAIGEIEIDYIRFIEDSNYLANVNKPLELKNGDATGAEVTFTSNNATISIVKDPLNENNSVYKVESSKEGEQWTYTIQDVTFKPAKKYIIEYDAMLIGTNDGKKADKADLILNLRYNDDGGKWDHVSGRVEITSDKWTHFKSEEITLLPTSDRGKDQFSIFANPINKLAVSYYLDNIKITEID